MVNVKREPASPDEILTAAEAYAKAGLKIYPVLIAGLKPDGKKDVRVPVSWKGAATDDLEQVRRWWRDEFPGYGIGVDTGASKVAVVDADVKDGVNGIKRARDENLFRQAPPGSKTPSGGAHAWFRDPDSSVGSTANAFGTKQEPSGIDIRGVGGTIFMPPTFVPGYGRYEWMDGVVPDFSTLPEVPAKLAAVCPPGGRKNAKASTSSAAPAAEAIAAGESQLFARPVLAADRQVTFDEAKRQLRPLYDAVVETKSPNGVWQAVASFARAAAHFQCYFDRPWVEQAVLQAYAEGGHGYTELDADDLRAISSAYAMQEEARSEGDLDEGWLAEPIFPPAADEVDALIGEMLSLEEVTKRPPKRTLIDELLHFDSEAWVIGPPGSYKSFVVLDMALHVALGQPWQGLRVQQAEVVIIAAEGAGGLSNRVKAWEKKNGPLPSGVWILPRPVQAKDVHAWKVLVEACKRIKPGLVIGDTQARISVGLQENDATDMGIYVSAISAMREATGACVLSVHHTGRNGGDARGSSAIDGAQDTELKVTAESAKAGGQLAGKLQVEKQKDLEQREPIPLRFERIELEPDEDGKPQSSLVLLSPDVWRSAEVDVSELDLEPWRGQKPEQWTASLVAANAKVQRRILQVLADHAGGTGLTEASVRKVVTDRWERPADTGWTDSWQRVKDLDICINVGGERWALDAAELAALRA